MAESPPMSILETGPSRSALRSSARGRLFRLGYVVLVFVLITLNAWWWMWDLPPADMATIDSWIVLHRDTEAEGALRSLLQRSRSHGEARMKLARLLGKRDAYLDCADQLHLVPDWWPNKPDALFLEAQAYKLAHRARQAELAWKACLVDDPLHPVPLRLAYGAARELVGIYMLELRLDEARETLMQTCAMAAPADRAGILVLRMQVELQRIRPEVAAATLRDYVRADPDDWQALLALAREEQASGNPGSADRHIAACLAARPEDPASWRTFLEILHQRGDREGFQDAVSRLPSLADGDAEIWKYRGLARAWALDFSGADAAFTEAIRLAPFTPDYHYRLAINANSLGLADRAEEHLRRHRELQGAQSRLRDALNAFLDASQQGGPHDAPYREAVDRLATLCEQLGWGQESAAWRQLLHDGEAEGPPVSPQPPDV